MIVLIMFYFNRINRNEIRTGFETITKAEGITIKDLINISGYHLIELGEKKLFDFLDELYENKNIIYLGVIREGDLLYLKSRYEGYFPINENETSFRFFKSPVGRIFEIKSGFLDPKGRKYQFYIGFNYEFLTIFESSSRKNFLMIMAVILLILIFLIIFIIRYDKKVYKKNLEFIREKEDKEHFKDLSLLTSEIAHEIKNPLNSIYLSFSVLEKYLIKGNEDAVFYKDAIKNEIKRISEIINSYSSVSKKVRVNYNRIEFDHFLNEFYLLKKKELENLGIEIKIKNSVKTFISDKELLTQIMLNLVNNAIDANAKEIEIDVNYKKEDLEIIIKDNGDEIKQEIIDSIFKPYISSKIKGMGLGLHITMKLLKAFNGTIQLMSWSKGNKVFRLNIKENKNG